MKKYVYLIAILLFALTAVACGGGEKTETNETKQISTAPNSNAALSTQTINAANENTAARRDDFDEDDVPPVNSNRSVNGKVGSREKKDADDARSGNVNQKRLDRDDKSRNANTRRDSDDFGKRDNDRDADDN